MKKTTEKYMFSLPHGLTTIAIYVNFLFSLRKVLPFGKVKLSVNQKIVSLKIQDDKRIFYAPILSGFFGKWNWFMLFLTDWCMQTKKWGTSEGGKLSHSFSFDVKNVAKTFIFVFLMPRRSAAKSKTESAFSENMFVHLWVMSRKGAFEFLHVTVVNDRDLWTFSAFETCFGQNNN